MDSQMLLQWPGTKLKSEVNDTKKAGEIGEIARRAERCLGKRLGIARHAYSKHELSARHLLSNKFLASQHSYHGRQWSITSLTSVMN